MRKHALKILFVAFRDLKHPYSVGGDIYINMIAKKLTELGHEVTLLTTKFPGCREKERDGNLRIIRLGNWLTMPIITFYYYTKFLKGKVDVIIEEILGGQRLPFLMATYAKEKIVGIWHQKHTEIFKRQYPPFLASLLIFLERFLALLYRNKKIVANSKKTRSDLTRMGLRNSNIHIVYPGISDLFFNTQKLNDSDIKDREKSAVFLGKLRRYKMVHHLLYATKIVKKKIPDFTVIIAGKRSDVDPKYEAKLYNVINSLNLNDSVSFKWSISEEEKIRLLRKCMFLVLPSAIEGFGMVIIEANACGTPAIVSDRVPDDALKHGYNGLRYPFGDIHALSVAMVKLLEDKKLWEKLSHNSLLWAQQFRWEYSAKKMDRIIREVISVD